MFESPAWAGGGRPFFAAYMGFDLCLSIFPRHQRNAVKKPRFDLAKDGDVIRCFVPQRDKIFDFRGVIKSIHSRNRGRFVVRGLLFMVGSSLSKQRRYLEVV